MRCDKRLKLWCTTTINNRITRLDTVKTEPINFFTEDEIALPWLTKFKGKLNPTQMLKDIVFNPSKDNEPYRKKVIKW